METCFVIPVGDEGYGVGQVVGMYGKSTYYMAVFGVIPEVTEQSWRAELHQEVALFALSMDAKVHVGHWSVVGQATVSADIQLPWYKEARDVHGWFDAVDASGAVRRKATPEEIALLPNRKVVAPVRIENALKAGLGQMEWDEAYDELLGPGAQRVLHALK